MRKMLWGPVALLPLALTACGGIGSKSASLSIIYIAAAVVSLLLLVGYVYLVRTREPWFVVLFASVLVVNVGYYLLSVAQSLEWALWCNRLAYLGSVFLPLAMLMIILGAANIRCSRWVPIALIGLAAVVLFIAASPGWLGIYYADVALVRINGVSSLDKVYGPLHVVYLIYLLGYFSAMTAVIFRAAEKKKLASTAHVAVLLIAVFVNICVWLIEQLVRINFEFLSVSYVISEMFLLGLHMVIWEGREKEPMEVPAPVPVEIPAPTEEPVLQALPEEDKLDRFANGLKELTQTERAVYEYYIAGKTTKEIMELLSIKENTLKFHNKNLYGKLGVSSRKQLLSIYAQLNNENR